VSKIDHAPWLNPFTEHGLRLPRSTGGNVWQLHEAGHMMLSDQWQHQGVCSPFWRLFYDFGPGAWVSCAGRRHELHPDGVVILPGGVTFDCGSRAGTDHLWLHFSPQMALPVQPAAIIALRVDEAFRAVAHALRGAVDRAEAEPAGHLGSALLHVTLAGPAAGLFDLPERRLRRLLAWVEHNVGGKITNVELAAQCGMSVEPFIRWFKTRTGRTPAVFVAEWRVREACRRLAYGDDSIERIADDLGFSNRYHFSRVFRNYAGCGPATFRRGNSK